MHCNYSQYVDSLYNLTSYADVNGTQTCKTYLETLDVVDNYWIDSFQLTKYFNPQLFIEDHKMGYRAQNAQLQFLSSTQTPGQALNANRVINDIHDNFFQSSFKTTLETFQFENGF